ncbi:MAG: hypothetical protein KGH61_03700 [Candidatus Micrarchaeota archaeon]|nr:hypothetical protein [Candidatus Micrarchaeota archaeon]MDE1848026.1 hypothetical protein [Candidatus Micrarchaeota archaeon]MDE1864597.1 hypothetical protein [Candidatus Micrarchaeota archaeon]
MAEPIIGTIVVSCSPKRFYALYHLSFTDQRVFAIEGSAGSAASMFPKIGGTAGAILSGIMSSGILMSGGLGGMNTARSVPSMQEQRRLAGERQWIAIRQAMGDKSVIDYDHTEVTPEMQNLPSVSIQYEKIKEVKFKKTLLFSDYEIVFEMGMLSSETFLVADSEVEPIRALFAKTPLASKLKQ